MFLLYLKLSENPMQNPFFRKKFSYPANISDDLFSHLHLNFYLHNWIIGRPPAGCPDRHTPGASSVRQC